MTDQKTSHLVLLLVASLVAQKKLAGLPRIFNGVEKTLSLPASVAMIFLIQGVYGAKGIVETPQKIEDVFTYPAVRFTMLVLIAYTGTKRIGTAILMVISFLLSLQLVRSPSERRRHPYIM